MLPFFKRLGNLAFEEMRALTVPPGKQVPAGEYGFLESFCTDTSCDCRRVMIQVVGQFSQDKVWATISYGWEGKAFYRKWSRNAEGVDGQPVLDPLNPQSTYAEFFLEVFKQMIQDKAYVDRLKRHYKMFRDFRPVLS